MLIVGSVTVIVDETNGLLAAVDAHGTTVPIVVDNSGSLLGQFKRQRSKRSVVEVPPALIYEVKDHSARSYVYRQAQGQRYSRKALDGSQVEYMGKETTTSVPEVATTSTTEATTTTTSTTTTTVSTTSTTTMPSTTTIEDGGEDVIDRNMDEDPVKTKEEGVCRAELTGLKTSPCHRVEEYKVTKCGSGCDSDVDIRALVDICKKPSKDQLCHLEVKDEGSCKSHHFKFIRLLDHSPSCNQQVKCVISGHYCGY